MVASYNTLHGAPLSPPLSSIHKSALPPAWYLILLLRHGLLGCVLEVVLEDWLWVRLESLFRVSTLLEGVVFIANIRQAAS